MVMIDITSKLVVDVDEFLDAIKEKYPNGFTCRQARNFIWEWARIELLRLHHGTDPYFDLSSLLKQLKKWGYLKEIERLKTGKGGYAVYVVIPSIPPAPKEAGILEGVL